MYFGVGMGDRYGELRLAVAYTRYAGDVINAFFLLMNESGMVVPDRQTGWMRPDLYFVIANTTSVGLPPLLWSSMLQAGSQFHPKNHPTNPPCTIRMPTPVPTILRARRFLLPILTLILVLTLGRIELP